MNTRIAPNIWQLQSQGNIAGIIEALETRDPSIRRRAIGALKALDAGEAVPHLKALHEREFNPEMRELIETTLLHLTRHVKKVETTQEDRKRELLHQLESTDADKLLAAIHELSQLGDHTVVENIVMVFRNPTHAAKVRLAAAEALLKLESAPATVSLLGALRKPDWQVRRNAAAVLGQLEADWCVEPLIDAMDNDPHLAVRKTAAAALRRINTPAALAAVKASDVPNPTEPVIPISLPIPESRVTQVAAQIKPETTPATPEATPAPASLPEISESLSSTLLPDLEALPQPAWLRKKRPLINPNKDNKP